MPVVTAEKMAAGGDAIARLDDGRVVFVRGALPGERVRVDVHTSKRDFAKGEMIEVVEPGEGRVVPPCPALAGGCGGCGWQHIEPVHQLRWKADIVRDALRRTARLDDAQVELAGAVPPWAYRTTMRFAVAPDGRVGIRAASSHRVVRLDECLVAHPAINSLLPSLRVRGAEEATVRVSDATGECTLLLSEPGATVTGAPDHVVVGPAGSLHETVAGASLRVSAPSFFQSGPAAAELLVHEVRRACGDHLDGSPWLDAYGGVGLFAATLGGPATVVESSRSACADARVNVPQATVECTPFEKWAPAAFGLAVVDPARTGLGREAADVLATTEASRIVLVSCDPVAMARDTALLVEHGYSHRGSRVLDLFPHTPHVEVVTVLDRERVTAR
jgi:23S rRNA (uracil1939-C5)-methyltransferase